MRKALLPLCVALAQPAAELNKVEMTDLGDPVVQFLRYGAMFDRGLLRAGSR